MANEANLKPFKKGYDSRRGSKPKGSKHVSTWVKELLYDEKSDITVDGKRYRGMPIKAMIKAQIIRAIEGDPRAFDLLIKHGWGRIYEGYVDDLEDTPLIFINNVPIGVNPDEVPDPDEEPEQPTY